jgi:hypothetical protein
MGIDIPNTRLKSGSGRRTHPKSKDPYLGLLVKVWIITCSNGFC